MSNELNKSPASSGVTHDQQVRLIEATNIVIQSLNQSIPPNYRHAVTDSEATITTTQPIKHSESNSSLTSLEFKSCTSNENSQSSEVFRSCDSQLDEAGSDSATESDIVMPLQQSDHEDSRYADIGSSTSQDGHDVDSEDLKLTLQTLKQRLDQHITTALDGAMTWQEARRDTDDLALTVYLRELHNQYIRNGHVTLTDQSWFSLLIEKALSSSLQAHDIVMLSKEIEALKMIADFKEGGIDAQETTSVDTAIQTELSLDTYSISSLDSEISDRNASPDSLLIPVSRNERLDSQRSAYSTLPQQKPKRKLEVPSTLIGESVDYTPPEGQTSTNNGCCPLFRCLKRMCLT